MTAEAHTQLAGFIWSSCNLLRGPYKRNEYRKVILLLTVLRRFDGLLATTKAQVLAEHPKIKTKPETVVRSLLEKIFDNTDFGFNKITVERPLRLNFQATAERIARLETESGFARLATSSKKNEKARLEEIETGKRRQEAIHQLLARFADFRSTARSCTI